MHKVIAAVGIISAAFVITYFGVAFDEHPPTSSQDFAAWVQAFGSIGAILVAVWVSYHQHEKQQERDKCAEAEEVESMLLSLRDEIGTLWQLYERRVGNLLAADPDGTAFLYRWPIQEKPFTVYDSCVGRIGKIKDQKLRQKIIVTYGHAWGLVASFRANNAMVQDFEEANAIAHRSGVDDDVEEAARKLLRLQKYADTLRISAAEVRDLVADLLAHLPHD